MLNLPGFFFPSGAQDAYPAERRIRLILVSGFLALCAVLSLSSGIAAFFSGAAPESAPMGILDKYAELAAALGFVFLFFRLRSRHECFPINLIALAMAGALLFLRALRGEGGGLPWISAFPFAIVFLAGFKTGSVFAAGFGALCALVFLDPFSRLGSPFSGPQAEALAAYLVVAAFSAFAMRQVERLSETFELERRRLESARLAQGALFERLSPPGAAVEPAAESADGARSVLPSQAAERRGSASELEQLSLVLSELLEKKREFYVLYRGDVLDTLESLPEPEALISHVLLESLAAGSPEEGSERAASGRSSGGSGALAGSSRAGAFVCRSLNVEDLFAKAESILEIREAKKRIEFNKIQSQIDGLFPHENELESAQAGFERISAEYDFSNREVEVAKGILKGLSNKEISQELFISIDTVKTHVKNLMRKCDVSSRIELIKLFSRMGP